MDRALLLLRAGDAAAASLPRATTCQTSTSTARPGTLQAHAPTGPPLGGRLQALNEPDLTREPRSQESRFSSIDEIANELGTGPLHRQLRWLTPKAQACRGIQGAS